MPIHILSYQATQKEEVLNMMQAFNELDGYPFDREAAAHNLEKFGGNPVLGRLYLIRQDDQNVGYMVLTFGFSFEYGGRDAFLDEIYIKEDYQNKGIGQQAIEFLESEAAKLGVKALHLEVETLNEKAIKLYQRRGFSESGRKLLTKRLS